MGKKGATKSKGGFSNGNASSSFAQSRKNIKVDPCLTADPANPYCFAADPTDSTVLVLTTEPTL
jgi:hypothetical protein